MSIDTKGVTQVMPQLGNYNVAKEVISKNGEAQKNDNKTNEDIGLKTKDVKKSVVKTDDLTKIVEEVNDALKSLDVKRGYRVDKELNKTIVSIIDTETDDIIRQIPMEDAIRLAKNINEIIGLFYDDRV